jgi:hypothetical protein
VAIAEEIEGLHACLLRVELDDELSGTALVPCLEDEGGWDGDVLDDGDELVGQVNLRLEQHAQVEHSGDDDEVVDDVVADDGHGGAREVRGKDVAIEEGEVTCWPRMVDRSVDTLFCNEAICAGSPCVVTPVLLLISSQ